MGKSKKIFIFVVLIVILIAVFSVIRKKRELASFEKPKNYPLVVNASNVKQGELESYQKFLGEFRPENDAVVSSKFSATVLYVANEGTKVKKGDLVFKLDSSDIESNISALTYSQKAILDQIDSAKAQVEASNTQYINAKKEYERYKGLYEKELISKEQLENIENLYKQALANKENALSKVKQLEDQAKSVAGQIESLKSNLKYTEYRAPFDGVVANKFVNVGDVALAGKPVVEVVGSGKYLVYVNVPTELALKVNKGDVEKVSYNGQSVDAVVEDVLQSAQNNLSIIKLYVSNNPFNLPAHTFVDVFIREGKCDGFIVHANSVVKKVDGYYVIGIKDSKAHLFPVVVKAKTLAEACVNGNLSTIDKVVVGDESLLQRIYEGQKLIEFRGKN